MFLLEKLTSGRVSYVPLARYRCHSIFSDKDDNKEKDTSRENSFSSFDNNKTSCSFYNDHGPTMKPRLFPPTTSKQIVVVHFTGSVFSDTAMLVKISQTVYSTITNDHVSLSPKQSQHRVCMGSKEQERNEGVDKMEIM